MEELTEKKHKLLAFLQEDLLLEAEQVLGRSTKRHYRAIGAGPENGLGAFHQHERKDSSSFAPSAGSSGFKSHKTVPVVRIDTLIGEVFDGEVPEILKLDCEGWDLEVVKGAGDYLSRIPVLFLEVGVANPFFSNTVVAAINQLEASGYRLFNVGDAARNGNGVLWNAELCFVHESHIVWTSATTWFGN